MTEIVSSISVDSTSNIRTRTRSTNQKQKAKRKKACVSCRSSKIRCDMTETVDGYPATCSNCRDRNEMCTGPQPTTKAIDRIRKKNVNFETNGPAITRDFVTGNGVAMTSQIYELQGQGSVTTRRMQPQETPLRLRMPQSDDNEEPQTMQFSLPPMSASSSGFNSFNYLDPFLLPGAGAQVSTDGMLEHVPIHSYSDSHLFGREMPSVSHFQQSNVNTEAVLGVVNNPFGPFQYSLQE